MPSQSSTSNGKRKASGSLISASKKAKSGSSSSPDEEQYGIVDRKFYPPEMTNARCLEYNQNKLPRPIEVLEEALEDTQSEREKVDVRNAVVHWFKTDLRTRDNKGLYLASEKAKSKDVPLICLYIVSPQDFQAHITSPVRVDFILRTLEILKEDLSKLNIPLYVETVDKRKTIVGRILELCERWGASHLYTNIEYEVDELRREAALVRSGLEKDIAIIPVPDTCVVAPGELSSGTGNQYAVYSPWFRAWIKFLHDNPRHLHVYDVPSQIPSWARERFEDLFDSNIPPAPANKTLDDEERKRFKTMWPPGEHEAHERLDRFLSQKVGKYSANRNFPAANATAMLSVHFAAGTLSARSAIVAARDANSSKKLDAGNGGIMGWISEVAWRDFYKHVLAHWPYVW